MCGRFVITTPMAALAALFDAAPDNDLPQGERFNVCPTQDIVVVTSFDRVRRLRAMRWGLVPGWYRTPTDGPLLINARAETVAEKPAFRLAVRERRCLIAADGFYEWTQGDNGARLPWYISRADGGMMALAGVWQEWEQGGQRLTTCAIVSTAAGRQMAVLHHREPVIVEASDWPMWLGESGKGAALLMKSRGEGALAMHRVGVAVNSNRAAGPALVAALVA